MYRTGSNVGVRCTEPCAVSGQFQSRDVLMAPATGRLESEQWAGDERRLGVLCSRGTVHAAHVSLRHRSGDEDWSDVLLPGGRSRIGEQLQRLAAERGGVQ